MPTTSKEKNETDWDKVHTQSHKSKIQKKKWSLVIARGKLFHI